MPCATARCSLLLLLLLLVAVCTAAAVHVQGDLVTDITDALEDDGGRALKDKEEKAVALKDKEEEAVALKDKARKAVALKDKEEEAVALKDEEKEAVALRGEGREAVHLKAQHVVLVFGPDSGLGGDCRNGTSCPEHERCSDDDGVCECVPGFQWTLAQHNQQVCSRCPGVGHSCREEQCCHPASETWCSSDGICRCLYESGECSELTVDQFKLATQIALVSAIVLVIACLLVLLWRTCRKQRGLRVRGRAQRRSDASQASLTSVQLRVVERLRNRPPGYHDRTHIRIEKPPSYEETVAQPLRFPALALEGVQADAVSAPSGGGADNAALEDDELDSKQAPAPELHM